MSKETLDAKGLKCPMPIVEVAKKVKTMQPGDELEVIGDDPVFKIDIEAWCSKMGHEILATKVEGETTTISLKVAA